MLRRGCFVIQAPNVLTTAGGDIADDLIKRVLLNENISSSRQFCNNRFLIHYSNVTLTYWRSKSPASIGLFVQQFVQSENKESIDPPPPPPLPIAIVGWNAFYTTPPPPSTTTNTQVHRGPAMRSIDAFLVVGLSPAIFDAKTLITCSTTHTILFTQYHQVAWITNGVYDCPNMSC